MFDWDDLRLFLAAARAGSLTAAARTLGLDAATVGRRVARLETALRSTLLVRSSTGLELTAAGSRLLASAQSAETVMQAALEGADPALGGGVVRISASEGFGSAVLAPALPDLRARRPHLRVELAANPGFLSPARREVDLAITLSPPGDARLRVEPLTDYQLALYAAPAYLAAKGAPRDLADLQRFEAVGYVEDLIYAPELRYLDAIPELPRPAFASSSIRAQREMIVAGGGVGVLPCFLAEGLVRLLPRHILISRRFWISAHREIAEVERIRTARSWVRRLARERKAMLLPY